MRCLTTQLLRNILIAASFIVLWQIIVLLLHLPSYLLPTPEEVVTTLINNISFLAAQTWPTVLETLLGLVLGSLLGIIAALSMILLTPLRLWMMPFLVISQAIPTFAIAPLLVIWLGYGLASKIVMTMLMLFFPVASALFDGLQRTPSGWLDLAKTMNGSKWQILWHIRWPASLPLLATGLRVATAIAPIGAIVGEWVGSSRGLGFLMLNANARLQIDVVFACLVIIVIFALTLYFAVDRLLRWWVWWKR